MRRNCKKSVNETQHKKDRKGFCPFAAFLTSKPVSRVLSFKTAIYLDVELPPRSSRPLNATGPVYCVPTALLRIEFTATDCSQPSGELLPRLSTLTHGHRCDCGRYISVALFLGSPPAGVTRYPCPVEPGLSSRKGLSPLPRDCLFSSRVYCTQNSGKSQWEVDQ